ncbi:MAG TPA: amidohydrolase/deacetylase family metallohydrolase [Rhodobacteraceae bacterium]|nr:amidohydrolase/deacetylase family metallohydrolase [Paracoccaceae bacterium]
MTGSFVLRGGRVIDPANGVDRVADLVLGKDEILGLDVPEPDGAQVIDCQGSIVTPGMIDLHVHVYWGGTSLGVKPEDFADKSACTTLVDAGSAGPGNFTGFREHVIERSRVRILAYLHVSFAGIYGFGGRIMVGESHDMRLMAAREAAAVATAHPGVIVGIKVRIGAHASGPSGIAPLDVAQDVADRTGLPLMVHIDEPPPSYSDVVARLRKGDVLTHCFRPFPNAPCHGDGRVRDAVLAARERGVIFDIAHGMGSFSWDSARKMDAAGFRPDVISSDIHAFCINGPAHDNLNVMTKFLALGWSVKDVIAAASIAPARVLSRPDLGHLGNTAQPEASVIRQTPGSVDLADVTGEVVNYDSMLTPVGTVSGGKWHPA